MAGSVMRPSACKRLTIYHFIWNSPSVKRPVIAEYGQQYNTVEPTVQQSINDSDVSRNGIGISVCAG